MDRRDRWQLQLYGIDECLLAHAVCQDQWRVLTDSSGLYTRQSSVLLFRCDGHHSTTIDDLSAHAAKTNKACCDVARCVTLDGANTFTASQLFALQALWAVNRRRAKQRAPKHVRARGPDKMRKEPPPYRRVSRGNYIYAKAFLSGNGYWIWGRREGRGGRLERTHQMVPKTTGATERSTHTRTKLLDWLERCKQCYTVKKASRNVVAIVNRRTAMLLRSFQNTLIDELTNAGLKEYGIRSATARNVYCRFEACRVVVAAVVTSLRSSRTVQYRYLMGYKLQQKEHYATHASADAMHN